MWNKHNRRAERMPKAFTLVEILIVVVILGILASLVMIAVGGVVDDSRQTAFVSDVRVFSDAAMLYTIETGQLLEDSASGTVPSGWESYIDTDGWTSPTPIGGVWDFELNSFCITSAFGVHFIDGDEPANDDAYMTETDAIFDDGDLATGKFRKIGADRYYRILRN